MKKENKKPEPVKVKTVQEIIKETNKEEPVKVSSWGKKNRKK